MLGSTLQATIGLNISRFRAGLNDAVSKAGEARRKMAKELGGVGAGNLVRFFGVGALVSGLNSAAKEAQRLRDAAYETGAPLSASALAAAELGDNLDRSKQFLSDITMGAVGGVQRGVESIATSVVAFLTGATSEGIKAQREMEREADRIAKENARKVMEREREKKRVMSELASLRERQSREEVEESRRIAKAIADAIAKEADLDRQIQDEKDKFARIDETNEQKLARLKREGLAAVREANDAAKTGVERAEAELRARKLALEVTLLDRQIKAGAAAEKKQALDRIASLKEQLSLLRQQGRALREQMQEMERARTLPSLAEVATGERNIGPAARRQARELEKERQRELTLRDRAQRAEERERREGSTGAKDNARREREKATTAADESRSRQKDLERGLKGRVTDIGNETEKAQLVQLQEIKQAVVDTSLALRDASVPQP
jgi:hypothetical protein